MLKQRRQTNSGISERITNKNIIPNVSWQFDPNLGQFIAAYADCGLPKCQLLELSGVIIVISRMVWRALTGW